MITYITKLYSIKHGKTTLYNPKANGLTERANGIMEKILNKMVSTHKRDWDKKLPLAVHAYNTSEKKTSGKSPDSLLLGIRTGSSARNRAGHTLKEKTMTNPCTDNKTNFHLYI